MNVHDNYEKKLEYISMFNGVCLNVEEKLKLEIGLNELHNKIKSEELWFWGKITGTESDYFFALAINYKDHYEFPEKVFYYTTSATYNFEKLPETFEYHDKDLQMNYNANYPIIGNPNLVITKYKEEVDPNDPDAGNTGDAGDQGNQDPNNQDPDANNNMSNVNPIDLDESIENVKVEEVIKENYTELLKISYIVRSIDYDTNIVPQGAFKLLPIHELRPNDSFKGLKAEELRDFSKFHHFRPITHQKNKQLIESDDAIFRYDFLDSIQDDEVKGSWGIQLDSTKTICNVRSLLWPGYFSIHKANTNLFGGVYIGNGMKNFELPFMI